MIDCVDLIKLPLWIQLRALNVNFGRMASRKMLLLLQTLQLLLKFLWISFPCHYNCSSLGKLASRQPPASKSAELTLLKKIEVDSYFSWGLLWSSLRYFNHFIMIINTSQYAYLHLMALLSRLLSSKLGSWLSPSRWGAPNPDDVNKDDDHRCQT